MDRLTNCLMSIGLALLTGALALSLLNLARMFDA